MEYTAQYNEYLNLINERLEKAFDSYSFENRGSSGLDKMKEAMAYSVKCGGKRIRPVLTLAFCEACGGNVEDAVDFAAAVEMVHTYSLIHDDLPCMDDDDLRRGKPSNHKVFGYANALLAGDSLLTYAFETALNSDVEPEIRSSCALELSKAAGPSGMIAGQVMDLENENKEVTLSDIENTDNLKTGEMIAVAAKIGCIAAGADKNKLDAAEIYCRRIGLAFQIEDDVLDVTASEDVFGKPIGSDAENCKNTYVSFMGIEKSKELINKLTDEAVEVINVFGEKAWFLKSLALNLRDRKN